jgi:7-keto-8-aminopelargonate synthetase-like enzyme
MNIKSSWTSTIDSIVNEGVSHGLAQCTTDDAFYNGRTVCLNGRHMLNFALCSYLGLELDSRLKQGTIDAVTRYGTQFAMSRSYLSATPYTELETILEEFRVCSGNSTTTLGHIAALPVLIQEVMYYPRPMVHNSVQTAANWCRRKELQSKPCFTVIWRCLRKESAR